MSPDQELELAYARAFPHQVVEAYTDAPERTRLSSDDLRVGIKMLVRQYVHGLTRMSCTHGEPVSIAQAAGNMRHGVDLARAALSELVVHDAPKCVTGQA